MVQKIDPNKQITLIRGSDFVVQGTFKINNVPEDLTNYELYMQARTGLGRENPAIFSLSTLVTTGSHIKKDADQTTNPGVFSLIIPGVDSNAVEPQVLWFDILFEKNAQAPIQAFAQYTLRVVDTQTDRQAF